MNTPPMPTWLLVVSSAGVGALVSSLLTLAAQFFDRRARRRELLLAKSIELAMGRSRFLAELALKKDRDFAVEDDVLMAEKYYQWLQHLLTHETLPADAPALEGKSRSQVTK